MTKRTIYYAVMDLRNPSAEPFAVISCDTTRASNGTCPATIVSLHWQREEAERIVHEFNEGPLS